tara:strand:- start:38 stop:385 length:348 start_codon:yes stop_codon:yes gene_type:complete
MERQVMSITILTLPRSLLEPGIVVVVQVINCLLVIGLVKICGLEAKKQRIPVQRNELGDSIMSCSCANNMSNKRGGSMYGKRKGTKKAYSTVKPRKGGMKKPAVGGKKLYTYKDI